MKTTAQRLSRPFGRLGTYPRDYYARVEYNSLFRRFLWAIGSVMLVPTALIAHTTRTPLVSAAAILVVLFISYWMMKYPMERKPINMC